MHKEQYEFVLYLRNTFPQYFSERKIVEIGSLNINGSIRDLFHNCEYVGVDVGEGLGVDVVSSGHEFNGPTNYYDVAISTECFEHNPYWVETFANMIRMCKTGGLVAFTCANENRPEHGTARSNPGACPLTQELGWGEYYRNLTANDFRDKFGFGSIFSDYGFIDGYYYEHTIHKKPMDLYFWGIKL